MNTDKIFPKGQKAIENFTGDAWVEMLTTDAENFDAMSYNVTFAPGCRNYWHSHPGGQLLFCTSGLMSRHHERMLLAAHAAS